jgi:iron complex outermembrane recepter protein
MSNKKSNNGQRKSLLAGASIVAAAAALSGAPALAQEEQTEEAIVVTGSRIQRQDYVSTSPITTVAQEQLVRNADVTIDTFLNTLPAVNPAATTTSNNPGNGGQSNVDLRGLGANRNLVLLDGSRAMMSANNQTVDVNTIPQAMIGNIEVITGGAGAVYGADAVAGVVNFRLRDDFEGVDLRATYSNSTEFWDAEEYNISGVVGANFDNGRGNFSMGIDRTFREIMIKSQRDFSANATATTSFLPEGNFFFSSTNAPTEAAYDAIFATYGSPAGAQTLASGVTGFNLNGTLFYRGVFNSPLDAVNFLYPIDLSVNTNLYPDVYSYNFDSVNILTLPLERTSFLSRFNYRFDNDVEVYGRAGWSEYTSTTALAPTPFPTVAGRAPGQTTLASQFTSPLISAAGCPTVANPAALCNISNLMIIPVTNPWIPTDLLTLLNSRSGDNPALVGSGATEPFTLRQRTLDVGLRESVNENTVVQFLVGSRGPIGDSGWDYDVSLSHGITEIDVTQTGNVDTQRVQQLLEAADGGVSVCGPGGFNVFGRQPLSAACVAFLEKSAAQSTVFESDIFNAFVSGALFEMPAGPAQIVLGGEYRGFSFDFDPGAAGGPISGFNSTPAAGGENSFVDIFGELALPLSSQLEVTLGARRSSSESTDTVAGTAGGQSDDWTYKADAVWTPSDSWLFRASYQHAVRAPNFGELFAGGGSAPEIFDPCSAGTAQLTANLAAMSALCTATGLVGVGTFVQTPGTQVSLTTAGNPNLDPEVADTYTIGAVFTAPWDGVDLRASIDYYNISIEDAILAPGVNQVIASCYNYYGTNPTYSITDPSCTAIYRAGSDILAIYGTGPNGTYPGVNAPGIQTSGIDIQIDYRRDLGSAGDLRFNVLMTRLLEWSQQDAEFLPELDFAGTAGFFGEGLGQSFPEWKATLNTSWEIGDFAFNMRNRYIGSMENRATVLFPGESAQFTGTDAIWYTDLSADWHMTDNATLRLGLNNVADEQPPEYAPNVQSGTDPSLFDVVGRRVFVQMNLRY